GRRDVITGRASAADELRRTAERLRGRAVELEADERLAARDPGVVTGLDHVRVAGADVDLGAVVVHDVHRARHDGAAVVRLAAVGPGDRLDALRPLPARLRGQARRLDAAEIDDREVRLVGCANLVRLVERLLHGTSHFELLSWREISLAQLRSSITSRSVNWIGPSTSAACF